MQEIDMKLHRAKRLKGHTCPGGDTVGMELPFDADIYDWSARVFVSAGVWNTATENGETYYAYRKQSLGIKQFSASALIYTPLEFHNISEVKTDIRAVTDRISVGAVIGWQFDGHYHIRIDRLPGEWEHISILKTKPRVTAFYDTLGVCDTDAFKVGEWTELTVKTAQADGKVTFTVLIDGKECLTAVDEAPSGFLCGAVGCRVAEGEADFKSFSVCGVPEKSEAPVSPECEFDIHEYSYDYADCRYPTHEGTKLPSHFVYTPDSANWKQSKTALTVSAHDDSPVCFHTLSKNSEIKATFSAKRGKFGFIARNFIPDGYIKAGLDTSDNVWFIEDAVGPDNKERHNVQNDIKSDGYLLSLKLCDDTAELTVNGKAVLSVKVKNTYHGHLGLFAQGTKLAVGSLSLVTDAPVTEDIVAYSIFPKIYSHYGQILDTDDKTMLAVFAKNVLVSRDGGLNFSEDKKKKYNAINTAGGYCSLIRRSDGKIIQVLSDDRLTVQESTDGSKWETVGCVVPEADRYDECGNKLCAHHVDTLREIKLSGGPRLFMPVVFRVYGAKKVFSDEYQLNGHFTRVYYSDDGGKTWTSSENDTRDIISNSYKGGGCSFTESKVLRCPDGTLCLYVTRFDNNGVHYIASHDDGKTWEGLYAPEGMVCGRTSHGTREDPYNNGNYYMAYVKDEPYAIGSLFPRTQLILAHSTDGMNWHDVMLLDRLPYIAVPTSYDLYQFLDPSIYINRDYIYVAYGKSVGEGEAYHNAQRTHYIRLKRPDLDNMDMPYKALHKSKKVE